MRIAKYSTFLILVNVISSVHCQSNQLRWESASTISNNELLPAGKEDSFIYYVARGSVRNNWLNGKSLIINGEHVAYVPYEGQEAEGVDFQVLVAPPETISWVATSDGFLPDHWIVGGTEPESEESTFICRYFHENHLIVGKGLESSGECFVGFLNEVFSSSTYEILVLNDYGIATAAADIPEVSEPIFVERETTQTMPMHFKWPHVLLD